MTDNKNAEFISQAREGNAAAVVAKVLDDGFRLVINKGKRDGVSKGQRFRVFSPGEEIFDPSEDEKSLGILEVLRGIGIVAQVQDSLSVLESLEREPVTPKYPQLGSAFSNTTSVAEMLGLSAARAKAPFRDAMRGDLARPE